MKNLQAEAIRQSLGRCVRNIGGKIYPENTPEERAINRTRIVLLRDLGHSEGKRLYNDSHNTPN